MDNLASGTHKQFRNLLDLTGSDATRPDNSGLGPSVGDDADRPMLTALGPSVGDDPRVTMLGPSVGDDGCLPV